MVCPISKVMHVYGGSPKKMGSLEEYFLLLTRKLNKQGCKSVFIFGQQPEDHLMDAYTASGADIRIMRTTTSRLDIEIIKEFMKLYKVERPSVVNAHFDHTGINALIAARLFGVRKRVWTKHSLNSISYKGQLPLLKRILHTINWEGLWASDIIAVSHAVQNELKDHFIVRKVHQLYLGVALKRFSTGRQHPEKREELGIPEGRMVASCISQARPEKGIEYLVKAIGRLRGSEYRPYVLILGGGPLTPELERLAKTLGVENDVNFCGVRNDVEDILALSDFTILPSLEDAAPLSTMESLAAGKPMVCSRIGGIPEIIKHGENGLLVTPGRDDEMADAILYMCNDKSHLKKLSLGAHKSANAFDVEQGVKETMMVYSRVS